MGRSRHRTFCPYCGSVVPAGQRCACRPKPKRKPTAGDLTRAEREPWRARYDRADFQRNRQVVIARQHGRCADCGMVCAERRDGKWYTAGFGGEVDHIVPLCEGGTDEPSNLALRCKTCHSKAEAKRRYARRRARGNSWPEG